MGDLSKHFSRSELACKDGCGLIPTQEYIDFLEAVRVRFNRKMTPSGARCLKHNAAVGGKPNSPHVLRIASDTPTEDSTYRFELARATMEEAKERGLTVQIEIGIDGPREWLHIALDQSKPNKLFTSQEA